LITVSGDSVALVEERKDGGYGFPGGRLASMDKGNIEHTLSREVYAETGRIIPRQCNMYKVGVTYDFTEKRSYENHFYFATLDWTVRDDDVIKLVPIRTLLRKVANEDTDDNTKLRKWLYTALSERILVEELLSISFCGGIRKLGMKAITNLWDVYVFPEHVPGLTRMYKIEVSTDEDMRIMFTPSVVGIDEINREMRRPGYGSRCGMIVSANLDQVRNGNYDLNIMDIISKLPTKEGEECYDFHLCPLNDYLKIGVA
jgi:hypothetical protein